MNTYYKNIIRGVIVELINKESIEEVAAYPLKEHSKRKIEAIMRSFNTLLELTEREDVSPNDVLELEAEFYYLRNQISEKIVLMDKVRQQKKISMGERNDNRN